MENPDKNVCVVQELITSSKALIKTKIRDKKIYKLDNASNLYKSAIHIVIQFVVLNIFKKKRSHKLKVLTAKFSKF